VVKLYKKKLQRNDIHHNVNATVVFSYLFIYMILKMSFLNIF